MPIPSAGRHSSERFGIQCGVPAADVAAAAPLLFGAAHSVQHVNRHGPTTAGGGFAANVGGPVIFTLYGMGVRSVSALTVSEQLFEQFCAAHSLPFRRLTAGHSPTPDYEVELAGAIVRVEIEQIESKVGIDPLGVSTRTVGKHLRKKITDARRQVKASSSDGFPAILLVYNLVDEPFQAFGTEPHDFLAAMYGEYTVRLVDGKATDTFHGKNAKFRQDVYTYYSAVGHLRRTSEAPEVVLYENAFAERPLSWSQLPGCIRVQRVEVEGAA